MARLAPMLDLIAPGVGIAASAVATALASRRTNYLIATFLGWLTGVISTFAVWFVMFAWIRT
jgi:hypothetical protein